MSSENKHGRVYDRYPQSFHFCSSQSRSKIRLDPENFECMRVPYYFLMRYAGKTMHSYIYKIKDQDGIITSFSRDYE